MEMPARSSQVVLAKGDHGMRRIVSCAAALAVLVLFAACPSVRAAADTLAQTICPLNVMEDAGKFTVYVNEERIISIDFEWKADGSFTDNYTISMGGQSVSASVRIEVDENGLWKHIAVLFENSSPALMSQAVAAYDQQQGGKQTFPLFSVPAVVMDTSLEKLETVERFIGGVPQPFTLYRYGLPGVDVIVWVDKDNKVVLGEVPAQRAAYVREGYEALRLRAEPDSLLSQPAFEVNVEKNVPVPMRDGVKLATDIYRPAADGKFPVILSTSRTSMGPFSSSARSGGRMCSKKRRPPTSPERRWRISARRSTRSSSGSFP
jgi:hypothetical protein